MRGIRHRIREGGLLLLLAGMLSSCGPTVQERLQAEEHYRLSQSYLGNTAYFLAEQEIRKALELWPDEARYFGLLALIQQAQGRLSLAEASYRLALQQARVPAAVLVNYSTVLLQQGRLQETIELARRALQDPGYHRQALAYTNIGLAYMQQGALQQAAASLRMALEHQPELPEAHHNLALVYVRQGRYDEAMQAFRQAIHLRPSYVEAYAGLGQALLDRGRPEEARHAFERVIALAPESALAVDARRNLKLLTP